MTQRLRVSIWILAVLGLAGLIGVPVGSKYFGMQVSQFPSQVVRVTATPILGALYRNDLDWVQKQTASYWHGLPQQIPANQLPSAGPFVYEDPNVPYLAALRQSYRLDDLVQSAPSEYEAILKLAGWIGEQFDHGTNPVVGGSKVCEPVKLIEAGRRGGKYWCEIAARLMVHAAASVGLPGRMVTASTDGYTWEHAVAEIWSNEFGKWFVVDPDFNIVYEHDGVPQSATELVQFGKARKEAGTLRVRRLAPSKPSIPPGDALFVYRYVHVDMRNDWCTRSLRKGSPAGGDLATRWYAGKDISERLLTAKVRVPNAEGLASEVNNLISIPLDASGSRVALLAFSPYFSHFELDRGSGWINAGKEVVLTKTDRVRARATTEFGWHGPEYEYHGGALHILGAHRADGRDPA